jgi:hypothetical protein
VADQRALERHHRPAGGERLGDLRGDPHGRRTLPPGEENAAATEIELSDDRRRELDELFTPGATAGARYPTGHMSEIEL